MRSETLPIETFVNFVMQNDQRIRKIVAPWRIEPQRVEQVVVAQLREMGIFTVSNQQRDVVSKAVINQLNFAPEIKVMLRQAEKLEQARGRHREDG